VSGTRDLFLSDVVRVHRKMPIAGVTADLHVYEGVSHADYMVVIDSPESEQVDGELDAFVRQNLD
jgi:acetyl esterase/lipase